MRIDRYIEEALGAGATGLAVRSARPEGPAIRIGIEGEGGRRADLKIYRAGEAPSACATSRSFDIVYLTDGDGTTDEATRRMVEVAVGVILGLDREVRLGDWEETLGEEADSRFMCGNAVEIKITRECNQSCVFCKSSTRIENHATAAQIPAILGRLAGRARIVTLSGGEPCLDPMLASHVEAARRAGFERIEVQTNGMLMQERPFVRRLVKAGMTDVLVSLHSHRADVSDSLTRCRGGFSSTLRAMDTLLAEDVDVTVCHVICSPNHLHVPDYVRFILRRFPGSSLGLLFTLAIPTHRVRDDPSLMPRLSALAPPLKEGLSLCLPPKDRSTTSTVVHAASTIGAAIRMLPGMNGRRVPAALRRGIALVRGEAPRAKVISHCGIPLCMLEGCESYHEEHASASSFPADQDLFHPGACAPCMWRDRCSGIWRVYASRYGDGEIGPKQSTGS